ncbi:MAG TPA: TetR family transcriptional regulator [Acidimicrobiia bacterium]
MSFSTREYGAGAGGAGSGDGAEGWQARALARSLGGAHDRSVARMERLLDAARELADETGSAAFTVAQVADRAGMSLKGFYGCFAGKDDLLLALLEEDGRMGATILAELVAAHDDPVERLHAYVQGLFSMLTHPGAMGYAGVLVREHRRLGETRPDDLRVALAPIVDTLAAELRAAAAAGRAHTPDPARDAEVVFRLLLSGIHEVTLGRRDPADEAADLWRLCWSGLAAAPHD